MKPTLLVGTGKGLVIYKKNKKGWHFHQDYFIGMPVSLTYIDERSNTWWVCLAHRHWGQKLHRSTDEGKSWQAVATPKYPLGTKVKNGKPATLRYVWSLAHAGLDRPGELYLGTEPGGLFHSKDGGNSFQLMESLWEHPSRKDEWFGAGRDYPYIHSIVVDPRDSRHFYVAISVAGVFETRDSGQTWEVRNQGLKAEFLPDPYAKIGHDPHRMFACCVNPDVIWQQNHCGIFRSTDAALTWQEVTDKKGLADYGFALAIDHQNPDRAWVIPAESDDNRVAVNRALCVCRTEDGGQSWQALREGLPQEHAYDIVLRHGLSIRENHLAFGTTFGNLYVSADYGNSWDCLNHNLARVNSVSLV